MTGIIQKQWLFFKWKKQQYESFERQRGLQVFKEKFLHSPYPMVVVHPDFSQFNATFNQCYVYKPLADMIGKTAETKLEFYRRCLPGWLIHLKNAACAKRRFPPLDRWMSSTSASCMPR